jgi:nitrile hydratase subunit beta
MNGVHDLGGMHGFGPVEPEPNEPVFHADWEKRVYAINRAVRTRGLVNIDEFRHGVERMNPAHYLASSYYEHWLDSVARLLDEKGIVPSAEVETRMAALRANPDTPRPEYHDPELIAAMVRAIRAPLRTDWEAANGRQPRFAVGAAVRTRNVQPTGHTRLPRYARGKRGTIAAFRGIHTLPDANAHGHGEQPEPVYSVRFAGEELWSSSSEPREVVHLDLWESYLDPECTS